MSLQRKLSLAYFFNLTAVFLWPFYIAVLFILLKSRKRVKSEWLTTHYRYLLQSFIINTIWIFMTLLIIYLFSLIGYWSFMILFILGIISLVILWLYNVMRYFELVAFCEQGIAIEQPYFKDMLAFYGKIKSWKWKG